MLQKSQHLPPPKSDIGPRPKSAKERNRVQIQTVQQRAAAALAETHLNIARSNGVIPQKIKLQDWAPMFAAHSVQTF
jgi:hypothetical protein